MPTKKVSKRSLRQRHELNEKASLFFFLGLAATLVVVGVVLQGMGGLREGISDQAFDWRLKRLLPAGAELGPMAQVNLDLPVGARVVGYGLEGRSYLALLVPEGDGGKLFLKAQLDLTEIDPVFSGPPHIVARIIGPGASPAILARSQGKFDSQAVLFAVVENGAFRIIDMIDGGGNRRPAVFHHGYISEGQQEFSLEDLNGDNSEEAVVRGRYALHGDGSMGWNYSADAFVWHNGQWNYDRDMSFALTAANGLFPEPGSGQELDVGGDDSESQETGDE